ncbi:probable GTP-binding protein OBGC2 isoform X4 [Syzygium oleosum]|uniref:probable GTP-binding protein OBGC2 isoform X4 n=1 Tax=Syzygium oleosum TaxID=219896 RepID=UPI0024B93BBD|nr:probable GTP-binding protein OBGC2 isoform X4 [Syzygium oleosum]
MASLVQPPPPPPSFRRRRIIPSTAAASLFFGHSLPLRCSRRSEGSGRGLSRSAGYRSIECSRAARAKESPPSPTPASLAREPHKYFDRAVVTVRSGDGGHGAVLGMPGQDRASGKQREKERTRRRRGSLKRDFDGSLVLPVGGHGGDVVVYADEARDSLLEFHGRSRYNAKRGGNVDAMGVLTSLLHNGFAAPALRIPVPVGTVVKRKRGKLLADLANPGDEVLVARGGQGGVLVLGQPGEEGLPNAGKSTLLAAITHAKPDIADYPFTTLMPNLGRLDGDPNLGAGKYSSEATLADLPGLIEGAHLGKGLGRNFLRHLRRTRLLVHVVDAAAEDPVNDYRTVKEELRMYNPDYLERPYIVVLNKIDLPKAGDRVSHLTQKILEIGSERKPPESGMRSSSSDSGNEESLSSHVSDVRRDKEIEDYPGPLAVVAVSVLKGIRINEMLDEIRAALRKCKELNELLELASRS